MKILHHCSLDRLAVSAEDGSIAELDRVFGIQEQLILEPGNWFWFSRIKAKKEGQGVWIGFDCAHFGDLTPALDEYLGRQITREVRTYRDINYVTEQVRYLAQQIKELAK